MSEMRNDEFFHTIQKLIQEEEIKTALIVGAVNGEGSTEAFLAGASANRNKPLVLCVESSRPRLLHIKTKCHDSPAVRWYRLPSSKTSVTDHVARAVRAAKAVNENSFFDAVLIRDSPIRKQLGTGDTLAKEWTEAKCVILDGIHSRDNCEEYQRLIKDTRYLLVAANPGLRNGYGIFKKRDS
jgi:hypothetical protein